jgi:hypothetical protein
MTSRESYKHPGVLETMAQQEYTWFETFGTSPEFPVDYVVRVLTEKYGINHKRYFNIVFDRILELWLEDLEHQQVCI